MLNETDHYAGAEAHDSYYTITRDCDTVLTRDDFLDFIR